MTSFQPIRFETGRPMLLAGLRQHHAFTTAESGLLAQWERFESRDGLPGRVGSASYGVMCGHDATGFEYMCAVEVESFAGLPEETGRMRVPAQRYAVFAHQGDASTLRSTWEQVFAWLSGGSYTSAHLPDFEVYAGGIEVWVGVVPRDAQP